MKKLLRTHGVVVLSAVSLAGALLPGCSTLRSAGMGIGPATPAVVAARLTPAERDFAIREAAKGMYEVEVSKLAVDRAIDAGVRSFAQKMVREHTQANNELVALMSSRGVAPPKGLAADKATKLHRLASLPRSPAFDHGYVRVVGIEDHRANIALYERVLRETRDRELRSWIERTLSTLRAHLSAAQNLSATLAG